MAHSIYERLSSGYMARPDAYGEKAFVKYLDGPISKKWAGFYEMADTLKRVIEAVNECRDLIKSEFKRVQMDSLWYYIIIQYGKCFHENEGWCAQLNPSVSMKNSPNSLKSVHARVMEQRDSFIAHGGNSPHRVYKVVFLHREKTPKTIEGFEAMNIKSAIPTDEFLRNIKRLAEDNLDWISKHLVEIEKRMASELEREGYVLSEALKKAHREGKKVNFGEDKCIEMPYPAQHENKQQSD